MDRRNVLFSIEQRTPQQDAELSRLSDELSDLGFASDFKDPYYAAFVKKMAQHTKFHKEVLTPEEEQQQQDAIADDIISEILAMTVVVRSPKRLIFLIQLILMTFCY